MPLFTEHRSRFVAGCFGLGLSLLAGSAPVSAQQAPAAPDGQLFTSQSKATQDTFTATFGPTCASREWVWEHSLAIDADDLLAGPAAADGQTLADQDDDIQRPFVLMFGPQATAEWVAERNAFLAHKVLLNTVAPVQCPAAANAHPQDVIGTSHLGEAVDSAKDGDLDEVVGNFLAFRTIWNTSKADATKRAPAQAQAVQTAFDQVNALIGDPKAPAPVQAQYYPALQALQRAVRTANTTLAGGGASATTAASASGPAPQIVSRDLDQAVDWASKSDLTNARREFGEFTEGWEGVNDAVKAAAPTVYASVDGAVKKLNDLIGDTSKSPAQAQYYPAFQALQAAVKDGNTALAAIPAAAPAAPTAAAAPAAAAAAPAPQIPFRDLGQAVDWASKSDLTNARKEFGEFDEDWEKIADAVKAASPTVYASIDDALDDVSDLFGDASKTPAQSQYYPALQKLQQAVQDANTALGH